MEGQYRSDLEKSGYQRQQDEQGAVLPDLFQVQALPCVHATTSSKMSSSDIPRICLSSSTSPLNRYLAAAEKGDFLYQLFHLADEVGRNQDRLLAEAELTQQGLEDPPSGRRIDAPERFVHQHQFARPGEGGSHLQPRPLAV